MRSRRLSICLTTIACGLMWLHCLRGADAGMRTVDAKRFGIVVRCPAAWKLTVWARDDKAFVLRLPQEDGSPPGSVSCTLGVAPEKLESIEKQVCGHSTDAHDAPVSPTRKRGIPAANAEQPKDNTSTTRERVNSPDGKDDSKSPRKLVEEKISAVSAKQFGEARAKTLGNRFDAQWQTVDMRGRTTFELQTSLISEGTLYTFRLLSDEEHFEAYRLDFEEMLQNAQFSPPETGLQKLEGGYWMQREFRFAVQLPDGWQPGFGLSDKVLMFATGKHHDAVTDQLQISASAGKPADLEKLRETLPAEIAAADPHAKATCKIVAQGAVAALETVIETQQGETAVCTLERRFKGATRNYEIRFTCESAEFKKREAELRKALDGFREVAETPKKDLF